MTDIENKQIQDFVYLTWLRNIKPDVEFNSNDFLRWVNICINQLGEIKLLNYVPNKGLYVIFKSGKPVLIRNK